MDAFEILREQIAVWRGRIDLSQIEPLSKKISDKTFNAWRCDQAGGFFPQHFRSYQIALVRKLAQLFVRRGSPKEIREPCCKLMAVQFKTMFNDKQKIG